MDASQRAKPKQQRPGRTEAQKDERRRKRDRQKGKLDVRQSKTKWFFGKNDEWKAEDSDFKAGIKEIEFGPDFTVQDTHLDAIAGAAEVFRSKLEKVDLGARLGRTAMLISDDAMTRLAQACPNLKKIRLDAAVFINGTCIPSILMACPNITSLSITGNQRTLGRVVFPNLMPLATDPTVSASAPKLKSLDLRRAITGGDRLDYSEPLSAITAPAFGKNKLEVLFQHPTVGWERTYRNGRGKRQNMTQQRQVMAIMQEVMELVQYEVDNPRSEDDVSETKSELHVLIHSK